VRPALMNSVAGAVKASAGVPERGPKCPWMISESDYGCDPNRFDAVTYNRKEKSHAPVAMTGSSQDEL
jgi:hypothetical protein